MVTYRTKTKGWSPREIEDLRRLAANKTNSLNTIAAYMGRSRNSVAGMLQRLGIRLSDERPAVRAPKPKPDPLDGFLLNGEPLQFAETDRACARCGVRETVHRIDGCGQFAVELRVR